MLANEKHYPVYTAENKVIKVEELMSTDLQIIHEEDSIELASSIIDWKKIHHLPVENLNGELVGMVTDGLMQRHLQKGNPTATLIRDIMIKNVKSVSANDTLAKAKYLLDANQLSGIPVTFKNKLVGILTRNDLK